MTTWQLRTIRAVVFATLCVAMSATAHLSMSETGLSGYVLLAAFAGTAGVTWLLAGQRRGLAVISLWMTAAQAALHLMFERSSPMAMAGAAGAAPGQGHGALDWARLLLCAPDGLPNGLPGGMQPTDLARTAGLDPDALSAAGLPPYGPESAGQLYGGAAGMSDVSMMSHSMSQSMSQSMAEPVSMAHGLSTGMFLAHLLAALACALLLWRGEAAVVGLFELVRTLAAVLVPLFLLFVPRSPEPSVPGLPTLRRTGQPRSAVLTHAVVRRGPPAAAAVHSARPGRALYI
ncbi:hypothetical protein [Kitasatospora sp. GP82]|uniref:hypothetical protein n=1 Tax=Kitasatospora sp. GP82 TaxID=3035089 RepID=UPI00247350FA|nr:hypothetical protein [Kitasatospora sp. GP82]